MLVAEIGELAGGKFADVYVVNDDRAAVGLVERADDLQQSLPNDLVMPLTSIMGDNL